MSSPSLLDPSSLPVVSSLHAGSGRDPYRGVVLVLLATAFLGMTGAFGGGVMLVNPVMLDAAVTLAIATGVLVGVALAQTARSRPPEGDNEPSGPRGLKEGEEAGAGESAAGAPIPTLDSQIGDDETARSAPTRIPAWIGRWRRDVRKQADVKGATATAGLIGISLVLFFSLPPIQPAPLVALVAAAACLGGAGLAATAAHYLVDIDPAGLPESPGLCRGARVVAWILVLAAASMGLAWAGQLAVIRVLHLVVLAVNADLCYALLTIKPREHDLIETFPLDFGVLALLGSRINVLASVLDTAERQLGIDLRSTWALTVVRRGLEPLVMGLCLVGWLSTSLTVVGIGEQGLVERLGVPVEGQPLEPGLHVKWPWPVDQVFRIPVQRVQVVEVGHEGEEGGGPENVLWAVEHAPNEYTLVLGNGRDLITVDAAVQFRIADARAWRYHSQNPAVALKAIAYRAVMRNTVNKTLADALSENVVATTARMRAMVQQDADALGLGVQVLGFTVGGMHPPVAVASDYQAVVSAELGKVTAAVNAQALRNRTVPFAETTALVNENTARAEGAEALGRAAGEAWSFLTLESQYRSAPEEYVFRRRLETLEKGLAGRRFTVVDARFQRDGGELWVIP